MNKTICECGTVLTESKLYYIECSCGIIWKYDVKTGCYFKYNKTVNK